VVVDQVERASSCGTSSASTRSCGSPITPTSRRRTLSHGSTWSRSLRACRRMSARWCSTATPCASTISP